MHSRLHVCYFQTATLRGQAASAVLLEFASIPCVTLVLDQWRDNHVPAMPYTCAEYQPQSIQIHYSILHAFLINLK